LDHIHTRSFIDNDALRSATDVTRLALDLRDLRGLVDEGRVIDDHGGRLHVFMEVCGADEDE